MESLRVVSYNIAGDYMDHRDKTPDQHHTWPFRREYVNKALESYSPDIICLQELSPTQAKELAEHFKDYNARFLCQATSNIAIGESVGGLIGKITGTFVRSSLEIVKTDRFQSNGSHCETQTTLWLQIKIKDADPPMTVYFDDLYVLNRQSPFVGDYIARTSSIPLESISNQTLTLELKDIETKSLDINKTWTGSHIIIFKPESIWKRLNSTKREPQNENQGAFVREPRGDLSRNTLIWENPREFMTPFGLITPPEI